MRLAKKSLRYVALLALIPMYCVLGAVWLAGSFAEICGTWLDRRDQRLQAWAGTEW